MWRYHTEHNGWSDIAQHVTIGPEGAIWSGRDWNRPPASASGYNGNAAAGPFMFEMVGDFDEGRDVLDGAQLEAVIGIIARIQRHFSLGPDSLRFHRSMTNQKSCPGAAIDLAKIKAQVASAAGALQIARGPSPGIVWASTEDLGVREKPKLVMRAWQEAQQQESDTSGDELAESLMSEQQVLVLTGSIGTVVPSPNAAARAARGPGLSPEMLAALRPHVINLNQGCFSEEGAFQTSQADVDAIFDDILPRAVAARDGKPLRLLFWAHGGLISEASGLQIAHHQIEWWKKNDVYPIHFVWETGFLDAMGQILSGTRAMAPRGVPRDVADVTTDPVVELAARTLGGVKIWSAMKRSAELSAQAGGGALYVAGKLAKLCKDHGAAIELHAVGHSAGSIFHSQFLPAAFRSGAPRFETLQLLAPAIRVDAFKKTLSAHVGKEIGKLSMFTMQKDWEKDDNVARVYRKSLLYLIYYALEPERKTPILGLEASVRKDAVLANMFGLRGQPSPSAEVVWSVTSATSGPLASTSSTHGGLDNDRATMDSVAHRILGNPPVVTFPDEAIERAAELVWAAPAPSVFEPSGNGHYAGTAFAAAQPPRPATSHDGGGRRRALCVGIDTYPTMPLAGCVADAGDWADALAGLGFETATLLNDDATRSRILSELRRLVGESSRGDVVVFQFAGHGTTLKDLDGDEDQQDNGKKDEALCPYDIATGAYVIDDDLEEVFDGIPDGVNVTCFIDCCHSGTITRLMVGPASRAGGRDRRARYLPATAQTQATHRRFRERMGLRKRSGDHRSREDMREVLFSACKADEVAYETAGHGDFTVRATRLLAASAGAETNAEFQAMLTAQWGEPVQQHPQLDCGDHGPSRILLGTLVDAAPGLLSANGRAGSVADPSLHAAGKILRLVADALTAGTRS